MTLWQRLFDVISKLKTMMENLIILWMIWDLLNGHVNILAKGFSIEPK